MTASATAFMVLRRSMALRCIQRNASCSDRPWPVISRPLARSRTLRVLRQPAGPSTRTCQQGTGGRTGARAIAHGRRVILRTTRSAAPVTQPADRPCGARYEPRRDRRLLGSGAGPGWRNRHTRTPQKRLSSRTCGFESRSRHRLDRSSSSSNARSPPRPPTRSAAGSEHRSGHRQRHTVRVLDGLWLAGVPPAGPVRPSTVRSRSRPPRRRGTGAHAGEHLIGGIHRLDMS